MIDEFTAQDAQEIAQAISVRGGRRHRDEDLNSIYVYAGGSNSPIGTRNQILLDVLARHGYAFQARRGDDGVSPLFEKRAILASEGGKRYEWQYAKFPAAHK